MEHVVWQEANEALDTAHQISQILDTGLDKETLNILIALCESGVNPEVTDGEFPAHGLQSIADSVVLTRP